VANKLITPEALRERFVISSDVLSPRLEPHCHSASRRLKAWVGGEVYARALSPANEDEELAEALKNAEAHLAMHYALLGLNFNLRPGGLVKTEKTDSGQGGGNQTVTVYFSPTETAQLSGQLLELAREIAEGYIADGTPGTVFEFLSDE
jgi:hypothetical protein